MKPDYANAGLDLIIGALESSAIAKNKCPSCGGPFPCIPCERRAWDKVDELAMKLRAYYRRKGDPRGFV